MPRIFISYRRADSRKDAARLYDRLVEAFGKDNVFKDVDSIPPGSDFRGVLAEAVAQCEVVLAVIGPQWLTITDERGSRRLDNAGDFVRIELETGLCRDSCLTIPVLVDNAAMPRADDLPVSLRELAFKNAVVVRDDPDFHPDVDRLIASLQKRFAGLTSPPIRAAASAAKTIDVRAAVADFFQAMDEQDWNAASAILEQITSFVKAPRTFDVAYYRQQVQTAIWQEEAAGEYEILRMRARREPPERVWAALESFWQTYPGYDPDKLAEQCQAALKKVVKPAAPRVLRTADLLPAPFEWIEIPAGRVTLVTKKGWAKNYIPEGKSKTFDVPAFAIAKYPLTNAQYAKFIEAGGYGEKKWWTAEGWQQREKHGWTEPRYWQDDQWNGAEQPVVGVSWHEALSFCRWLREMSGENVMLPTEQQWQRAAQGDDGRTYPWGNEWDGDRCNNSIGEKNSSQTTPVRQYEGRGDSPFGVVDMAGNVWEWCLTAYESGSTSPDGTDVRVLRGGSSVLSNSVFFRAVYRDGRSPFSWNFDGGFRCARS